MLEVGRLYRDETTNQIAQAILKSAQQQAIQTNTERPGLDYRNFDFRSPRRGP